jgi:glycosyltransferase involved in cell wall biosynthesis
MATPLPVDVIVCTLDEEANLRTCLSSVAWASRRFVVDAGSTDATVAVAAECGAELVAHPWTGYSDQKNWALDNLPLTAEWVLFLDADERVPEALADEIRRAVEEPAGDGATGYYMARKMIFLGRWLRRTYWYPDYNLRLFQRGKGRFEARLVHERVVLSGQAGYLKSPLVHEDMRDLSTYVSRLNRYSTLEAMEMHRRRDGRDGERFTGSWFGDPARRRRALKESVWYRLPLRPTIRFVWTMIFRLGFLDGREGLIFTGLACMNEWLANVKVYELRFRESAGSEHPPTPMPELSGYRRPGRTKGGPEAGQTTSGPSTP